MRLRLSRLIRYLKSSFWFWPVVFIATGWWFAGFVARFSTNLPHDPSQLAEMRLAATLYAAPLLTTIAASAITVVTFVFSTLMVVLQLASSQLSPRILRKTIREGRAQLVMAVMVGTFVYAFRAMLIIYTNQDALVPVYLVIVGIALMILSVLSFLYFIGFVADRVRAPAVIRSIKDETALWLDKTYSFEEEPSHADPHASLEGLSGTPVRSHYTGAVTGVDVPSLVVWATSNSCVVALDEGLGSQITKGVVVGTVFSAKSCDGGRAVQRALVVESERTIPGDPPWGFRMLVDIANRALSPAVNDPTTAVQVIDALEELLSVLATRSEQPGVFYDAQGSVRVMLPVMSWRSYLELSTHEIYLYGKDSPQVTARLAAMIEQLESMVTTQDRKDALRELREQITVVGPIIALTPA